MNFDDYIAVELPDGKRGKVVSKDYAAARGLKTLPDESVIAHGRLRSTFRIDGRTNKPKARLPKAIPTPQTDVESDAGHTDSAAVENNEESL